MDECIEVTTARTSKGYGSSYIGYGRTRSGYRWHVQAHRFVYEQEHGRIPEGMMVCHRCDNPACINVDHLYLGTARDNRRDATVRARYPMNYCGHELKYTQGYEHLRDGTRCPECNRMKVRAWKKKKKEGEADASTQ